MLTEVACYGESIYLCETSKKDETSRFFMFLHDYQRMLISLGFHIAKCDGRGPDHWIFPIVPPPLLLQPDSDD